MYRWFTHLKWLGVTCESFFRTQSSVFFVSISYQWYTFVILSIFMTGGPIGGKNMKQATNNRLNNMYRSCSTLFSHSADIIWVCSVPCYYRGRCFWSYGLWLPVPVMTGHIHTTGTCYMICYFHVCSPGALIGCSWDVSLTHATGHCAVSDNVCLSRSLSGL